MPWEERKTSQLQEKFVKRVMAEEASKSALCREYGISRPTGSKWITRYQAGQQLEDRRRRPIQSPGKTTRSGRGADH